MVIEGLLNFGISESKLFLENAKSEPRRHFWKSKFRIFVNTFSFVFHLSVNIFEYFSLPLWEWFSYYAKFGVVGLRKKLIN